jgi:hypothetical protein
MTFQPDVHEAQATDVGAVAVVEQAGHLVPGQPHDRQPVQDAERRRNDSYKGSSLNKSGPNPNKHELQRQRAL